MIKSDLKQKAVHGVTWSLIERFGIQGTQFILGIILARLLSPADFGLIGMITVFFVIAQVLVDSGFGKAYIQKTHVEDIDANTIFYFNLIISIILYGILWIVAPNISDFYGQPALIILTRVMGSVVVINSFSVMQIAYLTRHLNFKRKAKVTLISIVFSGAFGIIAALNGFGVWALVINILTNRILLVFGLWFTSKWKPKIQISITSLKNMGAFGSWLFIASFLQTVFNNIYTIAIGKLFPIAQLGFYTKALQINVLSSEQITGAIGDVSFPILSALKDDKKNLLKSISKFLRNNLLIVTPISTILIVTAEPFTILLLTEKWSPIIPYIQLICITGVLYPIHFLNIQVLLAQGKSKLILYLTLLKNAFRVLNIVFMYQYGVLFIILGEVILSFFTLIINTWYTKKYIDYGFVKQFRDIWKILLSAMIAGLAGISVNLLTQNIWVLFFTEISIVMVVFFGLQYLFNKKLLLETVNLKIILFNEDQKNI